MCGIVAYLGSRTAYPILIKGLKRLEYRGYDSAGIALVGSAMNVVKCKGKDRKSTRLNSSHEFVSRMPSSA